MRESEFTLSQIKRMPDWEDSGIQSIKKGQFDLNLINEGPLREINEHVEKRSNSHSAIAEIYKEGLVQVNSPWLKTIEVMNERFYQNKSRAERGNYAVKAVLRWSQTIEKEVDRMVAEGKANVNDRDYMLEKYEQYAANKINKELSGAKQEKLDEWRKKGARRILNNALEEDLKFKPKKRNTTSVRIFIEKEYAPIIGEKTAEYSTTIYRSDPTTDDSVREESSASVVYKSHRYLWGAALIEAATVGGLIYGTLHPIGVKRSEISDFLNDNNKDEKHVLSDIKIKTPLPPAKPSDFSSLTPPAGH